MRDKLRTKDYFDERATREWRDTSIVNATFDDWCRQTTAISTGRSVL